MKVNIPSRKPDYDVSGTQLWFPEYVCRTYRKEYFQLRLAEDGFLMVWMDGRWKYAAAPDVVECHLDYLNREVENILLGE